jgi:hypothetical protein
LVESDELRSPWLNGDLQNSKKIIISIWLLRITTIRSF